MDVGLGLRRQLVAVLLPEVLEQPLLRLELAARLFQLGLQEAVGGPGHRAAILDVPGHEERPEALRHRCGDFRIVVEEAEVERRRLILPVSRPSLLHDHADVLAHLGDHFLRRQPLPLLRVEIELVDHLLKGGPTEHLHRQGVHPPIGLERDRRTDELVRDPLRVDRNQHVGLEQVRHSRRVDQGGEERDRVAE